MKSFYRAAQAVLPILLLSSQMATAAGFPGVLVEVNSERGQARLARASVKADFEKLAYHFESQSDRRLSGLASAAIVLNALRGESLERWHLAANGNPGSKQKMAIKTPSGVDPFYGRYTQRTVLMSDSHASETLKSGFKLRKYAQTLRAHKLAVTLRIADEKLSDEQIRTELITNLAQPGNFVIIDYNRIALGQVGASNMAPLGAYDERSDSFLILDVNPNVSPWVWVKSSDLISAMRTRDGRENRGYVLVSDHQRSAITTASR